MRGMRLLIETTAGVDHQLPQGTGMTVRASCFIICMCTQSSLL